MNLTTEQSKMLDDLLIEGFAKKTALLLDGKLTLVYKSLDIAAQLAVENEMKDVNGIPMFTVHTFSIKILSHVLVSYSAGGTTLKFKDPAEAEAFIRTRPTVVIDAMVKAHGEFEDELKTITGVEVIKENFTPTPSSEVVSS